MGYTAKRVQVEDAKPRTGRHQKALKAGPHGHQTSADGTPHSTPNSHGPTDGGQRGMNGMKDVKGTKNVKVRKGA